MTDLLVGVTNPAAARKSWVAVAGAVIAILITVLQTAQQFVPAEWTPAVVGVVALLTSVAVYFVPNTARQLTETEMEADRQAAAARPATPPPVVEPPPSSQGRPGRLP